MKVIYIAGPYSADNVLGVLDNIKAGLQQAKELMLHGYAPICPFVDFLYHLMLQDGESISVEAYQQASLALLEKADAVLLLRGWGNSPGVRREIKRAEELGIPVYWDGQEMIK